MATGHVEQDDRLVCTFQNRLGHFSEEICGRLLTLADEFRSQALPDPRRWWTQARWFWDGRYRRTSRELRNLRQAGVTEPRRLVEELAALPEHVRIRVEANLDVLWMLRQTRRQPKTRIEEETRPQGEVKDQLADYEIFESEADARRGGMGVVHRAWQNPPGRTVALKLIRSDVAISPTMQRHFEQEAAKAGLLDYPGLVPVLDAGVAGGRPYYAMPYIEGVSLREHLKKSGPRTPHDAAELLRSVADAIDYAHRRGVVHCDLKPENILIDENGPKVAGLGSPRVTDFGVARSLGRSAAGEPHGGTLKYMAPEQHRASPVPKAQIDIFALGVILYELLTGEVPFDATDPEDLLRQKQRRPEFLTWHNRPAPPRDLVAILCKCLQPSKWLRYATAAELARDLDNFLYTRPVAARRVSMVERLDKWRRRQPGAATAVATAAMALLVTAVGSLIAANVYRTQRDRADSLATESAERLSRQYVSNAGQALAAGNVFRALPWMVEALSVSRAGPQREQMHRRRIGAALRQVAQPVASFRQPSIQQVSWNADGQRVLVASYDAVHAINPATGKSMVKIKPGYPIACAAISADGSKIVTLASSTDDLHHDGTLHSVMLRKEPPKPSIANVDILAEPLIRTLPLGHVWDGTEGTCLATLTTRREISEPRGEDPHAHFVETQARFSSDGRYVLFRTADRQLLAWCLETCAQRNAGQEILLTEAAPAKVEVSESMDMNNFHTHDVRAILAAQFSNDGSYLDAIDQQGTIRRLDLASGEVVTRSTLDESQDLAVRAALTADASKAALVYAQGRIEVRSCDDGKTLISESLQERSFNAPLVVSLEFNASGERLLVAVQYVNRDTVTNHIGTKYFVWDFRFPLSDRRAVSVLPTKSGSSAAFDPTGRQLLVVSDEIVTLYDAQTFLPFGSALDHAERVAAAEWSPDGSRIAVIVDHSAVMRVADDDSNNDPNIDAQEESLDASQVRLWQVNHADPVKTNWKVGGFIGRAMADPTGRFMVVENGPPEHEDGKEPPATDPHDAELPPRFAVLDINQQKQFSLPEWPLDVRPHKTTWSRNGKYLHVQFLSPASEPRVAAANRDAPTPPTSEELAALAAPKRSFWGQPAIHRLWDLENRQIVHGPWEQCCHNAVAEFRSDSFAFLLMDLDRLRAWRIPQGESLLDQNSVENLLRVTNQPTKHFLVPIVAWTPELLICRSVSRFQCLGNRGQTVSVPLAQASRSILGSATSPTGEVMATIAEDARLQLWSLRDGRLLHDHIRVLTNDALIEFSDDGTKIATAVQGPQVRIWDVATGAPITPPITILDPATHSLMLLMRFSRDGSMLLTVAARSAALWDASTGERITSDFYPRVPMEALSFNKDHLRFLFVRHPSDGQFAPGLRDERNFNGRRLAKSLEIETWDISPATESVESLRQRVKALTHRQIDATAGLVALGVED